MELIHHETHICVADTHTVDVWFRDRPNGTLTLTAAREGGPPGFELRISIGDRRACTFNDQPVPWCLSVKDSLHVPGDGFWMAMREIIQLAGSDARRFPRPLINFAVELDRRIDRLWKGSEHRPLNAFAPEVRWFVYQHLAHDTTGRLAELIQTCPGAWVFAFAMAQADVQNPLLRDVEGGMPLNLAIDRSLAQWDAWLRESGDSPARRIFAHAPKGSLRTEQRLRIRRATAGVLPRHLWVPLGPWTIPDDIPPEDPLCAAHYAVVHSVVNRAIVHRALAPTVTARVLPFLSLHADVVSHHAAHKPDAVPAVIDSMLDYIICTGDIPCRTSSAVRFDDNYRSWLDASPGAPASPKGPVHFPAPPCAAWENGTLSLTALRNRRQLEDEGRRMRHCIATLWRAAARGDYAIYHGTCNDTELTVVLTRKGDAWSILQAQGIANAKPPPAIWKHLREWERALAGHQTHQLGLFA